jgi:hypothetical protein
MIRAFVPASSRNNGGAPHVALAITGSDLQPEGVKAHCHSLPRQIVHLIFLMEPANGCVVSGIAAAQDALPLRPGVHRVTQHRFGFISRHRAFEIAQVEQVDDRSCIETHKSKHAFVSEASAK